jgi:hypothetical protein
MKQSSGLFTFTILFLAVIAASVVLGSYDPIAPTVAHGQAELAIGAGWMTGISAASSWIFKLALGGIFTGLGVAAFGEGRKAYKLWKRNAQAGRWQSGPNANFQRNPATGPKLTRQDMLLLALSGRLPNDGKGPTFSTVNAPQDDDELGINL